MRHLHAQRRRPADASTTNGRGAQAIVLGGRQGRPGTAVESVQHMLRRPTGAIHGHRIPGGDPPVLLRDRRSELCRCRLLQRQPPTCSVASETPGHDLLFEVSLDREVDERPPQGGELGRRRGAALHDGHVAAGVVLDRAAERSRAPSPLRARGRTQAPDGVHRRAPCARPASRRATAERPDRTAPIGPARSRCLQRHRRSAAPRRSRAADATLLGRRSPAGQNR